MSLISINPYSFSAAVPDIVTSNMIMHLDAGQTASYPSPFTGSTWFDLTGNANNGALSGPIYNSGDNGSFVFDGINDIVNCGNVNFFGSGRITANAWVKLSSSKFQHIIDSNNGWHLAVLNDNKPYFWNGFSYHQFTPALSLNQWYMLTGVAGTTLDLYINGVLSQSIATDVLLGSQTIVVGNWQGFSRYWHGNIATATIYNRALNAAEVLQNFNALRGRYGL